VVRALSRLPMINSPDAALALKGTFAMHIIAEGRLMGFDAGDWLLLFAGALISVLLVFFI
jgi:hypothetical protein